MKRTTKKKLNTLIRFNESDYNKALTELKGQVNYHNLALMLCKKLTNDNVKEIDMARVEKYLNKKSGFLNSKMSADAFGMADEYDELTKALSVIKQSEFVVLDYDKYHLADTTEIKESFTMRFSDEDEALKVELDKILEQIKKSPKVLQRVLGIGTEYSITQLNAQFQMAKRGM